MRAVWFALTMLAVPFASAQEDLYRSMGGMPGTNGPVHCSVVDGLGNLYVGGNFTIAGNVQSSGVAKWDGTKWTSISPPLPSGGTVEAMAMDAQGNLYVGGSFHEMGGIPALRIAKWDGIQWHAMGTGLGFDGPYASQSVKSIAIAPNGQVYAGGFFAEAGSTTVNNIARWDGSQWHPLGTGFIDSAPSVNALAFDANGNLYATGRFKLQGDSTPISPGIAKWNGSAWSSVGTGFGAFPYHDATGNALKIDAAGNLIVAGQFTSAGGVPTKSIARWDGASWSAFGTGLVETGTGVRALGFTAGGDVLAASNSSIVGDSVQNQLVRWNGSTWVNAIPHPAINGLIRTFIILPNGHYVLGGDFQKLGLGGDTFHASHLVRWDGTRFHRFGNGPNGKVRAAKFDSNKHLVVGGEFQTIGDIEASGIARFDGVRWWAYGSGIDGVVHSLATGQNGEVFAGGIFNTAGGIASKSIAHWDGSQWVSMGGGLTHNSTDPIVKVLALNSDGALYAGGWISQSVSGVPLSGIARWQNGVWFDPGGGVRTADGLQPANGDVTSLAIDAQGGLIAGGHFIRMGTVSTNTSYIARWNGAEWTSVGPAGVLLRPFDQGVGIDCMAMSPGGVLHVGFRSTSVDSHSLCRLVSNTWQKMGNGFIQDPHAIAFDASNRIYVGGILTLTGPTPRHVLRGITYWDGSRWSSLGNEGLGMAGSFPDVMALVMDDLGNLILGGDFFGSSEGVVSPFLISTSTNHTNDFPDIAVEQPVGNVLVDGTAALAFGNSVTGVAVAKTVTLRNTGRANLTGLALTRSGANTSDFALGALGATTLAPGAATTFTVTFTPAAIGSRSAALQISSNDVNENPFNISLAGAGVESLGSEIVVEHPVGTDLVDDVSDLSFGSANIGVAVVKTITVRNTGAASLTGLVLTRSGLNASDFALSALGASSLASGESTTFTVTFTPAAAGSRNATFQISSNDANENPFNIPLGGTGILVLPPEIAVQHPVGTNLVDGETPLLFGNVQVGKTLRKTVTVRNTGKGTLKDLVLTRTGTNAAAFVLGDLGLTTLAPGASTTFTVVFTPLSLGVRSASLQIASNDADENPFNIPMSGTGVVAPVPEIVVQHPVGTNLEDGKSLLSFGDVPIGKSPSKTITIRNKGTSNLTGLSVRSVGLNASNFVMGDLGETRLIPGASTTFTVNFTPFAVGNFVAVLQIASNDADEKTFDIALAGTGFKPKVPEITVMEGTGSGRMLRNNLSTRDFGEVKVGNTSEEMTFTITNIGTAPLREVNVVIKGEDRGNFKVVKLPGTSVAPGSVTRFKIVFKPGSAGPSSAVLSIASNDANENPFRVTLAGQGVN